MEPEIAVIDSTTVTPVTPVLTPAEVETSLTIKVGEGEFPDVPITAQRGPESDVSPVLISEEAAAAAAAEVVIQNSEAPAATIAEAKAFTDDAANSTSVQAMAGESSESSTTNGVPSIETPSLTTTAIADDSSLVPPPPPSETSLHHGNDTTITTTTLSSPVVVVASTPAVIAAANSTPSTPKSVVPVIRPGKTLKIVKQTTTKTTGASKNELTTTKSLPVTTMLANPTPTTTTTALTPVKSISSPPSKVSPRALSPSPKPALALKPLPSREELAATRAEVAKREAIRRADAEKAHAKERLEEAAAILAKERADAQRSAAASRAFDEWRSSKERMIEEAKAAAAAERARIVAKLQLHDTAKAAERLTRIEKSASHRVLNLKSPSLVRSTAPGASPFFDYNSSSSRSAESTAFTDRLHAAEATETAEGVREVTAQTVFQAILAEGVAAPLVGFAPVPMLVLGGITVSIVGGSEEGGGTNAFEATVGALPPVTSPLKSATLPTPSARAAAILAGGPTALAVHNVDPGRLARQEALYRDPHSAELLAAALQGKPLPEGFEIDLGPSYARPNTSSSARKLRPVWDNSFASAHSLSGGPPRGQGAPPLDDIQLTAAIAARVDAQAERALERGEKERERAASAKRSPTSFDRSSSDSRRPIAVAFDKLSLRGAISARVGEEMTTDILGESGATSAAVAAFVRNIAMSGGSDEEIGAAIRAASASARTQSASGRRRAAESPRAASPRGGGALPTGSSGQNDDSSFAKHRPASSQGLLRRHVASPSFTEAPRAASPASARAALRALVPSINDSLLLPSSGRPVAARQGLTALNGGVETDVVPPQTRAQFDDEAIASARGFAAAGQRNAYAKLLATAPSLDADIAAAASQHPGLAAAIGAPVVASRYVGIEASQVITARTGAAAVEAAYAEERAGGATKTSSSPTVADPFAASSPRALQSDTTGDAFVTAREVLDKAGERVITLAVAQSTAADEKLVDTAVGVAITAAAATASATTGSANEEDVTVVGDVVSSALIQTNSSDSVAATTTNIALPQVTTSTAHKVSPPSPPSPLRPDTSQYFFGPTIDVLALSSLPFLQAPETDVAAIIIKVHRTTLYSFAQAHATSMLKTLDAALERFAAAPEKLWDACRKRYGDLVDPFQLTATSAAAGAADALVAARELARVTAEWNALASSPLRSTAESIKSTPSAVLSAAAIIRGVPTAVGYTSPQLPGIDVGGGRLLALTPESASTAPILTLEAAASGLAAIPASEWHKLALVSTPAPAVAAVLASICALLGIEVSWKSALAEIASNPSRLALRCADVTLDAWALAADVRDAGGPAPRLERSRIVLARKLLAKRPDVRAEARTLKLHVSSGSGGVDDDVESSFPVIAALAEWEFALVWAVDGGFGFNAQRESVPSTCVLRE